MKAKKEIEPMDFITITTAGNIVVTDPVTGDEYLYPFCQQGGVDYKRHLYCHLTAHGYGQGN